jgi:hypothetical protein
MSLTSELKSILSGNLTHLKTRWVRQLFEQDQVHDCESESKRPLLVCKVGQYIKWKWNQLEDTENAKQYYNLLTHTQKCIWIIWWIQHRHDSECYTI